MLPYDPRSSQTAVQEPPDGAQLPTDYSMPPTGHLGPDGTGPDGQQGGTADGGIPPLPEKFLQNLRDSINWSRRQIMPGIQKRIDILRQIVGRHYGSGGSKERVPQPFLRMQTSILARHLVSRSPRMMIETDNPQLRAVCKKFESWAKTRFDAMDLERVLFRWAYEALIYGVGIIKICSGLTPGHDGYPDLGEPYIDNVDPERAVWDMAAKSWKQLDFIGHRYTVAKEEMMKPDSGYDHERVATLRPDPYLQMNELGVEKTETLAQDTPFNYIRMREYIDVWEIFLPKEGLIVHLPVVGNIIETKPIMVERYIGMAGPDRCGPFHLLWYDEVPGNLMPSPPVHAIYDLHDAINRITRKLLRQADRQKTNLLVQSTMTEDAEKIKKAGDGDIVPVSHPEAFGEHRLGGPDQQNMAYMLNLKQLISWFGGNFDALGGLGPQSDTATQDKMLSSASTQLVQFMQQEVYSRTEEVMRSMLWYEWNSRRTQQTQLPIPGMPGHSVPAQVQPQQRGVDDFFIMQFAVHPYSMQPASPQQRVQQWMQLFQGVIMPSMGLMAQQGAVFDVMSFVRKIADYIGLSDLDDVLKVKQQDPEQPDEQEGEQAQGPRQRPPGTGEYHRTSSGPPGTNGPDQAVLDMMKQGQAQQQGQQQGQGT